MRGKKRIIVAAALALAFAVAVAAQAQSPLLVKAAARKAAAPVAVQTPAVTPVSTSKPADPPSGPIGTPGSSKTIKAHVLALELAVADLKDTVAALQTTITGLQTQVATLNDKVADILNSNVAKLDPYVSVHTGDIKELAGPHIFFHDANVHIVSGSGDTDDGGNTLTGRGNLVIGYNEDLIGTTLADRLGSHNLIIGPYHKYPTFGGIVAGSTNRISKESATVTGGQNNSADGRFSSVSGGAFRNVTAVTSWAGGELYQSH